MRCDTVTWHLLEYNIHVGDTEMKPGRVRERRLIFISNHVLGTGVLDKPFLG